MAAMEAFSGFPKEGIRFLTELADNNNRDWFNANKTTYLEKLQAPAAALVITLGERLKQIAPGVTYDPRTSGAGSLMRIYRDTRFSQDKTPYKTHIAMTFWEGPGKKNSYSGFFLRVAPEGASLFTGYHGLQKDHLAAYRQAVAEDPSGSKLIKAIDAVKQAGNYQIGELHYKRVPRGFDPDHPRADLLKYNSLYAYIENVAAKSLTRPEFVDVCLDHFSRMAPLHHWLVRALQDPQ